jgi:2-keto-3-deoxy-L-rhamnonate aldolase RhmA
MKNPVRESLNQGKVSLGAWLNLASPLAAEMMASAGFEWLAVDAEHSPFDIPLIAETFRAVEARGAVPFVRAWDHDPVSLARLLDAGALGIVIPHVSTPRQAEALARAMRYPPRGARSAGTGRIAVHGAAYRKVIDDEVLVIPQIEDMEGIDNTEAIMSVAGVDVGFLGPSDLALSMGVEPGHPDHEKAIQKFLAACKGVGKPCGLPVRIAQAARRRIAEGFQMLDVASDLRLLEAGAQEILKAIRTGA